MEEALKALGAAAEEAKRNAPAAAAVEPGQALFGMPAVNAITAGLSQGNIAEFVANFQATNDLSRTYFGDCAEMSSFLATVGCQKQEMVTRLLEKMRDNLIDDIKTFDSHQLTVLLDKAFPFIHFPELSPLVFAVLSAHSEIPPAFLEHIQNMPGVLEKCPLSVKRQIWAIRPQLFEPTILPLIDEYCSQFEMSQWSSALRYLPDFREPPANEEAPVATDALTQKVLDAMSQSMTISVTADKDKKKADGPIPASVFGVRRPPATAKIADIIGNSPIIYKFVVSCASNLFVETEDPRYAALRCDILMELHERGMTAIVEAEGSHMFIWNLYTFTRNAVLDKSRSTQLSSSREKLASECVSEVAFAAANPNTINAALFNICKYLTISIPENGDIKPPPAKRANSITAEVAEADAIIKLCCDLLCIQTEARQMIPDFTFPHNADETERLVIFVRMLREDKPLNSIKAIMNSIKPAKTFFLYYTAMMVSQCAHRPNLLRSDDGTSVVSKISSYLELAFTLEEFHKNSQFLVAICNAMGHIPAAIKDEKENALALLRAVTEELLANATVPAVVFHTFRMLGRIMSSSSAANKKIALDEIVPLVSAHHFGPIADHDCIKELNSAIHQAESNRQLDDLCQALKSIAAETPVKREASPGTGAHSPLPPQLLSDQEM